MRHIDIATEIRRMIAEERFDDALQILPTYAQAVTEECLGEEDFRAARDFLKAACKSVKARRAHYVTRLVELNGNRAYCGPTRPGGSLDVTG